MEQGLQPPVRVRADAKALIWAVRHEVPRRPVSVGEWLLEPAQLPERPCSRAAANTPARAPARCALATPGGTGQNCRAPWRELLCLLISSQPKPSQWPRSEAGGCLQDPTSELARPRDRAQFCCFPFYFTKKKANTAVIIEGFLARMAKKPQPSPCLEDVSRKPPQCWPSTPASVHCPALNKRLQVVTGSEMRPSVAVSAAFQLQSAVISAQRSRAEEGGHSPKTLQPGNETQELPLPWLPPLP